MINQQIGKSNHLIEWRKMPAKFKKLTKTDGELPTIIKVWEESEEDLKKENVWVFNLVTDKRRNQDLSLLTAKGGPFTTADQVAKFMALEMDEVERNKRLYLEVRFARDTSVAFPKVADIFRLKKAYKNLDSEIYAANLKAYLDKLMCHVNMNMDDLDNAINKLIFE